MLKMPLLRPSNELHPPIGALFYWLGVLKTVSVQAPKLQVSLPEYEFAQISQTFGDNTREGLCLRPHETRKIRYHARADH